MGRIRELVASEENVAKAGAELNALMRKVRAMCEEDGCTLSRQQEDVVAEALGTTTLRLVLVRERIEQDRLAKSDEADEVDKLRAEAQKSRDLNAQLAEKEREILRLKAVIYEETPRLRERLERAEQEVAQLTATLRTVTDHFRTIVGPAARSDNPVWAVERIVDLIEAQRELSRSLKEANEHLTASLVQAQSAADERDTWLAAQIAALGAVLTELVNLRDHVRVEEPEAYARRKPQAWQRARLVIEQLHPTAKALLAEVQRGRALVAEIDRLRRIETQAQNLIDTVPSLYAPGLVAALAEPRREFAPTESQLFSLVAVLVQRAAETGVPFPWELRDLHRLNVEGPVGQVIASCGGRASLAELRHEVAPNFWPHILDLLNALAKEVTDATDIPA